MESGRGADTAMAWGGCSNEGEAGHEGQIVNKLGGRGWRCGGQGQLAIQMEGTDEAVVVMAG